LILNKTIIIGLDGATFKIIKPLVDKGRLPFIKKMIDKGASSVLNSTIPCVSDIAAAALMTGKNPANSGIFAYVVDGKTINRPDMRKNTLFWDLIPGKSLIVNVRGTYPPYIKNGILASGELLTLNEDSDYVYPKEAKEKFRSFHKYLDRGLHDYGKDKDEDFFNLHINNISNQFHLFEKNLTNDFSFAFLWVGSTDIFQHSCWHKKDLLAKMYEKIDRHLAEFNKRNPHHNLLIISDHGFDKSSTKTVCINNLLEKEGYLKIKGGKLTQYTIGIVMSLVEKYFTYESLKSWLNIIKPKKKNQKNRPQKENQKKGIFIFHVPFLNYKKSVAYLNNVEGIKINKDLVSDYEKTREEIISKLKSVKHKGKNVFKGIYKREEIFKGKYARLTPDIIFLLDPVYNARASLGPFLFGKNVKMSVPAYHRLSRDGVLIAYGPNIKSTKLKEANLTDIAPTILYNYGIKAPQEFDGRVLKEFFKEGFSPHLTKARTHKETSSLKNVVLDINV